MANPHTLDLPYFRDLFPEFCDTSKAQLTMYWDLACEYIGAYDGCILSGKSRQHALNLMAAHLAKLSNTVQAGGSTGVVQSATEGSVSVSLVAPPIRTGWQSWLAGTPYGMQLWALLSIKSVGGYHVGGSFERQAFRKAGGVF